MRSLYHKPVDRLYFDEDDNRLKDGTFIARGEQADGHLAYTRLDEEGNDIEGEETSYIQRRTSVGLVMFHI